MNPGLLIPNLVSYLSYQLFVSRIYLLFCPPVLSGELWARRSSERFCHYINSPVNNATVWAAQWFHNQGLFYLSSTWDTSDIRPGGYLSWFAGCITFTLRVKTSFAKPGIWTFPQRFLLKQFTFFPAGGSITQTITCANCSFGSFRLPLASQQQESHSGWDFYNNSKLKR